MLARGADLAHQGFIAEIALVGVEEGIETHFFHAAITVWHIRGVVEPGAVGHLQESQEGGRQRCFQQGFDGGDLLRRGGRLGALERQMAVLRVISH